MFLLKLLIALIILGSLVDSAVKKWKFTNNILDPQNWVGGNPSENCKGVIFPQNLGSVGTVSQLYATEVVLPITGEIEIKNGGFIALVENSPCIRIKKLEHYHWFSPDSWDSASNSAVPDIEKVPCMEDDVVFPKNDTVSVFYPEISVQVNSIQIRGETVTNDEWQYFLQTDFGENQFTIAEEIETTAIQIKRVKCLSTGGCLCHGENDVLALVCDKVAQRKAHCFEPVKPIGHCNEICGGIIHLTVTNNFVLKTLTSKIPKYDNVEVHASKVLQGTDVLIQIVFVDVPNYNELSTRAAYNFHKQISRDFEDLGILSAVLYSSGMPLPEGSSWFVIAVATLFCTCILFGIMYMLYVGSLQKYNIISRIPVGEVSFKNIHPLWFSKFENREDGRMSIAESFISLDKEFDNPMYNAHRPSISSEALDVVTLIEPKASTSKTTHENPMFTEEERIEVIDVIEESGPPSQK